MDSPVVAPDTIPSQTAKREDRAAGRHSKGPRAEPVVSARLNPDGTPKLNPKTGKPYKNRYGGGRKQRGYFPIQMPASNHPGGHTYQKYQCAPSGERGKRDLWYLASHVLKRVYPDLVEKLHKPLCEFFVNKNPHKKWMVQDCVKNRLLLAPRGHFKTTINLCDIMQWLLAFPDVTIVLFSGTEQLTYRMVDEVKQHFLLNGDFREMYPQWVPDKNISQFGEKGEFTLPCRGMIRREPSLSITTLKSTRAGSHYDIEKFDDVVTEQNSKTAILNQETSRQWSTTLPLLNPGGFRDVIGTLYSYDCFYAPIIENYDKGRRDWKVLVKAALSRTPDTSLFQPEAVLFPERFCVDKDEDLSKQNLEQIWRDDPELFASQYMNDPLSLASDQFSIPRLKSHQIDKQDIPGTVNLYMTWDLAYSTTTHSDYSVGVLGGYSPNGSLFIVDVFRGRMRPQEIIEAIIQCYRKWPVIRVGIEKDQAAAMLLPGLEMRQRSMGLYIPIDMIPIKYSGMTPMQQILALGPMLEQNKLWFNTQCSQMEEMFREFSRYPKYAHDDICRAVSLQMFYRHSGYRPELEPNPEPVAIGGVGVCGMDSEIGAGICG